MDARASPLWAPELPVRIKRLSGTSWLATMALAHMMFHVMGLLIVVSQA